MPVKNITIGLYLAAFFYKQWNDIKLRPSVNNFNVLGWIIFGINVVISVVVFLLQAYGKQ